MGAHPWFYMVEFDRNPKRALLKLREREFAAGRYNPVMDFPPFPVEPDSPAPGAAHDSIEEAREAGYEEGTRSILDMVEVSDEPDFGVVAPMDPEVLLDIYGTAKPTKQMIVDSGYEFLEAIEMRGFGIYFTVYDDKGKPAHLLFAGYSYD